MKPHPPPIPIISIEEAVGKRISQVAECMSAMLIVFDDGKMACLEAKEWHGDTEIQEPMELPDYFAQDTLIRTGIATQGYFDQRDETRERERVKSIHETIARLKGELERLDKDR